MMSYQLWRAVASCLAQKKLEKREAMALKIQQKYIYTDSEHHIELTESLLELVDPMQEFERPSTPALMAVQLSVSKTLTRAVERYLIENGELRDSIGSMVSVDNKRKMSLTSKV